MRKQISSAIGAVMLLLLLSCGSTAGTRTMNSVERQATDFPARFDAPQGVTLGSNTCASPLTDPRDGTKITMHSSFGNEGVGDYVVPVGRYGVGDGELLRINCRTGEVLGIVRR